jgi:hypothetical protein
MLNQLSQSVKRPRPASLIVNRRKPKAPPALEIGLRPGALTVGEIVFLMLLVLVLLRV